MRFWTKPRVRAWTIFVAVVAAVDTALTLLVLAGTLSDTVALRGVVLLGLAPILESLITRAVVDIVEATDEPGRSQ